SGFLMRELLRKLAPGAVTNLVTLLFKRCHRTGTGPGQAIAVFALVRPDGRAAPPESGRHLCPPLDPRRQARLPEGRSPHRRLYRLGAGELSGVRSISPLVAGTRAACPEPA